jgi:hypothetical protein
VTGQPPWLHNALVRIGLHCCDGGEVAGGHAFEVEDWDQHFEAFRAPRKGGKIADEKRIRSEPWSTRSRTRGQRTAGPMPVMISRSYPPCHATRHPHTPAELRRGR